MKKTLTGSKAHITLNGKPVTYASHAMHVLRYPTIAKEKNDVLWLLYKLGIKSAKKYAQDEWTLTTASGPISVGTKI
jgi:hypothetical protein